MESDCKKLLKKVASDSNRFVFGYLCLDHMLEDFFDEDDDYPIGSIFADFISIPFAIQSACIYNSDNFNGALEKLDGKYKHVLENFPQLSDLNLARIGREIPTPPLNAAKSADDRLSDAENTSMHATEDLSLIHI